MSSTAQLITTKLRTALSSDEPELTLLGLVLDTDSPTLQDVLDGVLQLNADEQVTLLHSAPLTLLPALFAIVRTGSSVDVTAAGQLLQLLGKYGHAKEALMATQEIIERLRNVIVSRYEEGVDEVDVTDIAEYHCVVNLCSAAIPRLALRKLSPFEMLSPLLSAITQVYCLLVSSSLSYPALDLMRTTARITTACHRWLVSLNVSEVASERFKDRLAKFHLSCLSHVAPHIQSAIAGRSFIRIEPRYVVPGKSFVAENWEVGEAFVVQMSESLASTPRRLCETLALPSTDEENLHASVGAIILLVHLPPAELATIEVRSTFAASKDQVIFCLKTNHAVDSVVAWLWYLADRANKTAISLDEDDTISILMSLVPISSLSPDSSLRFITFRLVNHLLCLCSPLAQLSVLRDLMSSHCPFEQMRVASVSLAKAAVLTALADEKHLSPFKSPAFMQALGPVLLHPQPDDLFSHHLDLREFAESSEPARLTECLGLLYVLSRVDKANHTAIKNALPELQQHIIAPLQAKLEEWQAISAENPTALAGLIMAVERLAQ